MPAMPEPVVVRVRGRYRGHDLDGEVSLDLVEDALALAGGGREARIRVDRLR